MALLRQSDLSVTDICISAGANHGLRPSWSTREWDDRTAHRPARGCEAVGMVNDEEYFEIATRNRMLAADMFATLTPRQWATPSLCGGWTVREVAAHLVPPSGGLGLLKVLPAVIWYRGDLDRMVDEMSKKGARRPTERIVADLRARASAHLKPPVTGAGGPSTDTTVHLRDAARPLGLDVTPDLRAWKAALHFLVSKPAAKGFVSPRRIEGLRFEATDIAWSWGAGDLVRGSSEAVAMCIAGRSAYLDELQGPGVAVLRGRLSGA